MEKTVAKYEDTLNENSPSKMQTKRSNIKRTIAKDEDTLNENSPNRTQSKSNNLEETVAKDKDKIDENSQTKSKDTEGPLLKMRIHSMRIPLIEHNLRATI